MWSVSQAMWDWLHRLCGDKEHFIMGRLLIMLSQPNLATIVVGAELGKRILLIRDLEVGK